MLIDFDFYWSDMQHSLQSIPTNFSESARFFGIFFWRLWCVPLYDPGCNIVFETIYVYVYKLNWPDSQEKFVLTQFTEEKHGWETLKRPNFSILGE